MNQPLLSIVIPTYNRVAQLELLLQDASLVLAEYSGLVQVVVADNASTDRTPAVLETFRTRWPAAVKLVQRDVNIGMEGNIACAMMEGNGDYVWMLSDHQRLCVPAIHRTIEQLKVLDFDVGHAKILQWETVLNAPNTVVQWKAIDPRKRGKMLFTLSNLSTLIFKKDLGRSTARTIFRACIWGFPHLGIISGVKESTRFVEFESMSAFPAAAHGAKLVHGYDKVLVRYRSSIDCISQISREADVSFAVSGFFTPPYRKSFRGDMLQFLMQPDVTRRLAVRKLVPVILVNPWSLKLISSVALLGILLLPKALRLSLAATAKGMISDRRRRSETRDA